VRSVTGLLLGIGLALASSGPALAHALIVDSSPPDAAVLGSPPGEIRVRFSEPVQPFGPGISVLDPGGRAVSLGPVQVSGSELVAAFPAATPGTYLVRWRIVAEDTHPTRGQLSFSVGAPTATPTGQTEVGGVAPLGLLLQTLARWLHFLGLSLGFGSLPFRRWRLVGWGVLLLVLAEPVALVGQTASFEAAEALDPDAVSFALDSAFGRAMGVRLGGAFLLWLLVGVAQGGSRPALSLALLVGWLLALFDGSAAHAASLQPTWLGLLVNAVHLSAAALWVGGLATLVAGRTLAVERRTALITLGALGLTGLAMALAHLPRAVDLVATQYGLALGAKVVLVLVALLLARADRSRVELAAVVGVLLLAGLLVSLPPPA
jgi:copper transport protein